MLNMDGSCDSAAGADVGDAGCMKDVLRLSFDDTPVAGTKTQRAAATCKEKSRQVLAVQCAMCDGNPCVLLGDFVLQQT